MKEISVEEIIANKVLPYDILDVEGEKIFTAGEILTPGKALKLRDFEILFRNDVIVPKNSFAQKFKSGEIKNLDAELAEALKSQAREGIMLSDFVVKGSPELNKNIFKEILSLADAESDDFADEMTKRAGEFANAKDFIRSLLEAGSKKYDAGKLYAFVSVLKYNDVKEFEN